MSLTHVSGPASPPAEGVLVLAALRDASLRLPDFLDHHRRLGVAHFLIVDNGSTDGTADLLRAHSDVTQYHTTQPYSESGCGVDWMNTLLDAHGKGRWCLVLDHDELFVFPGWESASLPDLIAWLERTDAEAMAAPLLDMYPEGPLAALDYKPGDRLIEACPWFDPEGYTRDRDGFLTRGGARHRLFWAGRDRPFPSPVLRKVPLMRWREGLKLTASTHHLPGARLTEATGLLLHFKFLQDFGVSAREEAQRKEHFADARQYTAYADVLGSDPGFTAWHDGARRLEDSAQLVRLRLMAVSPGYPFAPGAGDGDLEGHWSNYIVREAKRGDLGGNLHHGDGQTITPVLWQALLDRFAPRCVLDVGAGEGHTLAWFARQGVIAHGFDGAPSNLRDPRHPIALHDLTRGAYIYPCDLVYCVEVVEHIHPDHLDNLLTTLCNAPVVAMSHALPGQRGHHHVNLQPESYWVAQMQARGYRPAIDSARFRAIAEAEQPGCFFGSTGLVFLRTRPGQETSHLKIKAG